MKVRAAIGARHLEGALTPFEALAIVGAEYPDADVDLAYCKAPDGTAVFTRKNGTVYG